MHLPHPKFSMHNFRPSPTHILNIIKVGHTVPKICSGQKTMDGGRRTADGTRRTDIWITKSLPELSSGETKKNNNDNNKTKTKQKQNQKKPNNNDNNKTTKQNKNKTKTKTKAKTNKKTRNKKQNKKKKKHIPIFKQITKHIALL